MSEQCFWHVEEEISALDKNRINSQLQGMWVELIANYKVCE